MVPKLVIFDCDGVLVDSEIIACRADSHELGKIGISVTADELAERFVGRSIKDMLDELSAEQGIAIPSGFADYLLEASHKTFEAELVALPNMRQALERLSMPLCVASSSDVARIEFSLRLTELYEYFHGAIFSAQMVTRGKPFPDLFLHAASEMRTAVDDCLVIEDSPAGVEAARAAGMGVFGFCGASHCQPGHEDKLTSAGASQLFHDMAALPAMIASS